MFLHNSVGITTAFMDFGRYNRCIRFCCKEEEGEK